MNDTVIMAGDGQAMRRSLRLRASSVFVALALVFAAMIVVQHRADAAPAAAVAAASVATASAANAQIDFRQFVCPILFAIRAAFASSPFFAIVAAALNPILAAFGCLPSGA
jgi:hypothetical protein